MIDPQTIDPQTIFNRLKAKGDTAMAECHDDNMGEMEENPEMWDSADESFVGGYEAGWLDALRALAEILGEE